MSLSRRTILSGASGLAITACATAAPAATYPAIGRIRRLDPALDALIDPDAVIEQLADGFSWSEGPVWINDGAGHLLFSDVPENRIHRWSEADGLSLFMSPSGLAQPDPAVREGGSNGLLIGPDNTILMADSGSRTVARLDLATKAKTVLADKYRDRRFNSPNDLVWAADGGLFFTDPPYGLKDGDASPAKELGFNGVYHLSATGQLTLVDDTISYPNGVGVSPDKKTLYVASSDPTRAIVVAWDIGAGGAVSNRRIIADLTDQVGEANPGLPDGMAVSSDGHLFATGPGGVVVLTPEGRTLGVIETGGPIANCTFGGPNGDVLYMTSGARLARVKTKARGV